MVACVPGFRHTSSPALLGVPQGVRDTSRLGCGGGLTGAALGPGLVHGVVHLPPRGGPAVDSPGTGKNCFGVVATTSETTPSSRLVLPAGTGLFPGESTSVAVSESNLPVRTGRSEGLGGLAGSRPYAQKPGPCAEQVRVWAAS